MSDIAERVKKIVIDHLGVDAEKVSEGASFIDDLGADSLDTVELVMAFEEEFGVEIPDDAAEFDPHRWRRRQVHRESPGLTFWLESLAGRTRGPFSPGAVGWPACTAGCDRQSVPPFPLVVTTACILIGVRPGTRTCKEP